MSLLGFVRLVEFFDHPLCQVVLLRVIGERDGAHVDDHAVFFLFTNRLDHLQNIGNQFLEQFLLLYLELLFGILDINLKITNFLLKREFFFCGLEVSKSLYSRRDEKGYFTIVK